MRYFGVKTLRSFALLLFSLGLAAGVLAQSNDQNYPTPITTNEIGATIKARDIGDARLTTHFYAFNGDQGDIFINVVTKNFSGDIDIFTVDGLRPLTKMVIYADGGVNETGRLIYLRKPERMLLRVQGRTPGDDTANYRIKFGGSFVALAPSKKNEELKLPVIGRDDGSVRVNSVGTILPTTDRPRVTTAKTLTVTDPAKKKPTKTDDTSITKIDKVTPDKQPIKPKEAPAKPSKPVPADPLQNIHLVIVLKDGSIIQRKMSEVFKFSVDKGVLTIIGKDGRISTISILDVTKVTIE